VTPRPRQPLAGLFTTNQHLALSVGLVSATTIGRLGWPLLRISSLPGLLSLNLYFVGQAVLRWRVAGRVEMVASASQFPLPLVTAR